MASAQKGCDRQHLGTSNHTLTATAMDTNLKHVLLLKWFSAPGNPHRARSSLFVVILILCAYDVLMHIKELR
jgi:hypothetical protein